MILFLGLAPLFAQTAQPQPDALSFFKNYFVTGDYVVGGVGLAGQGVNGLATNSIAIGGVPAGADIVAAFLYWETVESTMTPSATNGFFAGYPVTGKPVGTTTPPCWSSGGGTGSSQGSKTVRVYRADVRPYLPVDPVSARVLANGSFQVSLPDSGSSGNATPIGEGASLVIVYRVASPAVPLKAVVLYDGSWSMNNSTSFMSQGIQGFYQALASTAPGSARLTHIVANGQSNFSEQLSFQGGAATTFMATTPFTSAQGPNWDNPTFDVSAYVGDNASTVLTQVEPISSNIGCLSWGAVVFSTLVKNSDGDGLLDTWKDNQGYSDTATGAWVPLPGATRGTRDLFVQMDYLKKANTGAHSHLPKQAALDMVGAAFNAQGIHLHIDLGNNYQGDPYVIPYSATSAGGNIIDEDTQATCQDSTSALCEFPNQPGVVSWKGGFRYFKNQFFPHGRKDSYHYVLFGHTLGLASTSWSVALQTLVNVVNSGATATVTTATPHGLSAGTRVTVQGALANFNLNGTYFIQTVPSATTFTIATKNVTDGTYSNWGLAVATGPAKSTSGWSDLGGGDTMLTLGLWRSDNPADDQVGSVQVQAGTLMHELGHTLGLTHGGTYGPAPVAFGLNCKSNYQSVMNYLFQIRGLPGFDGLAHVDYSTQALPDLPEAGLNELTGLAASTLYRTRWYAPLNNNFLDKKLQSAGGRAATRHCNGTPLLPTDSPMVRLEGPLVSGAIDWNNDGTIDTPAPQDINFNGTYPDSTFSGFNDWITVDLRQIGARRNALGFSGDIGSGDLLGGGGGDLLGGGGGDLLGGGGGDLLGGGGGDLLGGGGGDLLGGGGGDLLGGGGGDLLGGGGGDLLGGGGGEEVNDFDLANSTVDPPTHVTAVEPAGAHSVNLNWTAPAFGQIRTYYIWRATGAITAPNLPTNIGKVTGTPPATAFTDQVKNSTTYTYFVTSALGNGNQSGPSNMVTITTNYSTGATGQ